MKITNEPINDIFVLTSSKFLILQKLNDFYIFDGHTKIQKYTKTVHKQLRIIKENDDKFVYFT